MRTLCATIALVLAASAARAAAPMGKGQPTPSHVCGECHKDIYAMWTSSAHARSMEGAVFLEAFKEAQRDEPPETSWLCTGCHAPLVQVTGDRALVQKASWEGVSCDVCHSVTAWDPSRPGTGLVLDVGPVKRGPIRDAVSSGHEIAFSDLHTGPRVCAGCHQYTNGEGTPIITTYDEWSRSDVGKAGTTCQGCHMGAVRANVVDPKVKRLPRTEVNLHEMPGGHSLQQLHRALGLTIRTHRAPDGLQVDVELRNQGAGHAVPTGMPGRRVILEVQLQGPGGVDVEERRTYTKSFEDSAGQRITKDSRYFSRGVRLVSDTRIQAGEKRIESLRFPSPNGPAFLTVSLVYEHSPMGSDERKTRITFQSERRTIPAGSE